MASQASCWGLWETRVTRAASGTSTSPEQQRAAREEGQTERAPRPPAGQALPSTSRVPGRQRWASPPA